MALTDNWQDLQDAVEGVPDSGSEITVAPINQIAHAVIDLEDKGTKITVDSKLDENSENPVQNKVVAVWIRTFDTEIGNNTKELVEIRNQIGNIDAALEELHTYAQALIGGEA